MNVQFYKIEIIYIIFCILSGHYIAHSVVGFFFIIIKQRFSAGTSQEFLKHAKPEYSARGTDLSSLTLSKRKKKKDNTQHNSYLE